MKLHKLLKLPKEQNKKRMEILSIINSRMTDELRYKRTQNYRTAGAKRATLFIISPRWKFCNPPPPHPKIYSAHQVDLTRSH